MKHLVLTLLSWTLMIGSLCAQCTITQPMITNASLVSGVAHFSLQFKHVRNNGNKWVTIHMWKSTDYPGHNYDVNGVPTTSKLGGVVPFGTIVINNSNISVSGTYPASQAFVTVYQNDGSFVMLNTLASTLVYNSSTDTYILNDLQVIIPAGTTVIKFDSWSSQSAGNNNVHCFNSTGEIVVPSVLPADLKGSLKVTVGSELVFGWTTTREQNNSHFVLEWLNENSEWVSRGTVFSHYETGNGNETVNYTLKLPLIRKKSGALMLNGLSGVLLVLVLVGVFIRKYIPLRITMLLGICCCSFIIACRKGNTLTEDTFKETHWYRLKQVDKDGSSTTWTPIQVRY